MERPARELAREVLHRGIATGEYPPGGWVREDELVPRAGVSRTPVREALQRRPHRAPLRRRVTDPDTPVLQLRATTHGLIALRQVGRTVVPAAAITAVLDTAVRRRPHPRRPPDPTVPGGT